MAKTLKQHGKEVKKMTKTKAKSPTKGKVKTGKPKKKKAKPKKKKPDNTDYSKPYRYV